MSNFNLNATEPRGFEVLQGYDSELPQRGTNRSAGYDFVAAEAVRLQPFERKLIETGITAYMPHNEEMQLRPRSGLTSKGIWVGFGTIDSDYYPGHIKVNVINLSGEPYTVQKGDRIAQGVFGGYKLARNDKPMKKERTGGFGHTGR